MKYKVDIVEDDTMISDLLKNHLQKYGFDVWVCEEFSSIDEQVKLNTSQLLLLDINLPFYDGFFGVKKFVNTVLCQSYFYQHATWT